MEVSFDAALVMKRSCNQLMGRKKSRASRCSCEDSFEFLKNKLELSLELVGFSWFGMVDGKLHSVSIDEITHSEAHRIGRFIAEEADWWSTVQQDD